MGYYYFITDAVREQVGKQFVASDVPAVIDALAETKLPLLPTTTPEVERIHFAVLLLSDGNLEDFHSMLVGATRDWRDILWGSGLGSQNWREILKERGIVLSLSYDHPQAPLHNKKADRNIIARILSRFG